MDASGESLCFYCTTRTHRVLSNYKHRTSTEFCKLSTAPKLSVIIFENSSKRGTPTNATERWTKRTYMYKHAPTKTIKLVVVNSILNVPCIWSKGYSWCIQLLLACPSKTSPVPNSGITCWITTCIVFTGAALLRAPTLRAAMCRTAQYGCLRHDTRFGSKSTNCKKIKDTHMVLLSCSVQV